MSFFQPGLTAKKLLVLLVLFISSTVFYYALPKFKASSNYVSVELALEKLANNKRLQPQQLAKLIMLAKTSIDLDNNPRYWSGLGQLYFYDAQSISDPNAKRIQLLAAQQSLEKSVSLAPRNAHAWYRLAVIDLFLKEPSEKTAKALRMSITTGPNEARFLIPRLSLSLAIFQAFPPNDMDLLRNQILAAWALSPQVFLKTFSDRPQAIAIIKLLLREQYSVVLDAMVEKLEKTHH